MCFVGFSIQIELSCCGWICCVIYSLPGHSAFSNDEFCHPKSKNARKNKALSFLGQNKAKSFFFFHSSRPCTCEFLDQALTMLYSHQAYLKRCCSLCEALVEMKAHLLYSGTNKFAYASIECCIGGCKLLFFFVSALISCHNCMWQSSVEIKGYSVRYFNRIAVFKAPYR